MELEPPTIHSQALHRVGQDGAHLGVAICFSSPDWQTPGLQFQYSIDAGQSWRPLSQNTSSSRHGWSGIVYGVRSGELVNLRAVVGDEFGPMTPFTVMAGIDAAADHLRTFVPKAPERRIRPSVSRHQLRRRVPLDRTVHFTVGFSQAYHSSPDCSALRAGQSGVAWRGGSPADVLSETVTDAIFEGKRPCRVCRPPGD